MTHRGAIAALALVLVGGLGGCSASEARVVVAAGTTLVDSGVVDVLASSYERAEPVVEVSVVGRSTRQVLDLGGRGAADLLITHAPSQEAAFLSQHPDAEAFALFSSRFLLVGPAERASALDGLTPKQAFSEIANRGWSFVTRADGSGTHDAEMEIWHEVGIRPKDASWYTETGQGMGLSLQVADQRAAFILVEEGTYLSAGAVLRLLPVDFAPGSYPENPYTAIVPAGNAMAEAFVVWMLSEAGRAVLAGANEELFGSTIFRGA